TMSSYFFAEEKENIPDELLDKLSNYNLTVGSSITDENLYKTDFIMLYSNDNKQAMETIKFIKAEPKLFLKPILIFSDHSIKELNAIVDDEIVLPVSDAVLNNKIQKLIKIAQKVNNLGNFYKKLDENDLKKVLILRYMLCRDNFLLEPIIQPNSSLGYYYPLFRLSMNSINSNDAELLEDLEEALLIKGKLIDKVHLCPYCQHVQINFRELCPNCHSLKIGEENTIHHFRCAYTGRERDFKQRYALICPKCDEELRHIGVDYDKPSVNLWCDDCDSAFSEALMNGLCLNCGNTFSTEELVFKPIKAFSITPKGSRAAEEGTLATFEAFDIFTNEIGLYKLEIFEELLKLEISRTSRYNFDSTLVYFNTNKLEKIIDEKTEVTYDPKFTKDLITLFKSTFRETDIITSLNDTKYVCILTNTNSEQSKIPFERLKVQVTNLINETVDFDFIFLDLRGETRGVANILQEIRG
ncbi:MAG: hypothetical protein ACE5H1_05135, partial [Thermodesulfobacteriota bacterium]